MLSFVTRRNAQDRNWIAGIPSQQNIRPRCHPPFAPGATHLRHRCHPPLPPVPSTFVTGATHRAAPRSVALDSFVSFWQRFHKSEAVTPIVV